MHRSSCVTKNACRQCIVQVFGTRWYFLIVGACTLAWCASFTIVIHRYAVNSSTSQLLHNQDELDSPALPSTSNQHTSDNDETRSVQSSWNETMQLKTAGNHTGKLKSESVCTSDGASMQRSILYGGFDKDRTLVLTMASSAQLQLLHIWIDVPHRKHQQYVVLALDEETAIECCEKHIPFVYDYNLTVGSGEDMTFKSEAFLRLGLAKFKSLKGFLEAGYSIIFSEIDVYELTNPEQCDSDTQQQRQLGCIHAHKMNNNYDLEIQPNILPGRVAKHGAEMNIGFFFLRSSAVSISFLNEILKCLENDCGWDQQVFTSLAWTKKWKCCVDDDNANVTQPACATRVKKDCGLRIRILNTYIFPTGGSGGLRRKRSRQYGISNPDYYMTTKICPALVHCTGRSGLPLKLDCVRHVQNLYGNCTGGEGIKQEYYNPNTFLG